MAKGPVTAVPLGGLHHGDAGRGGGGGAVVRLPRHEEDDGEDDGDDRQRPENQVALQQRRRRERGRGVRGGRVSVRHPALGRRVVGRAGAAGPRKDKAPAPPRANLAPRRDTRRDPAARPPPTRAVMPARRLLVPAALLLAPALAAAQTPAPDTLPEVRLDTLAVRVLRTPLPLLRAPYAVSVAAGDEVRRARPGLALDEALGGIPGVQVSNRYNYAVGERISVRGFGARAQFGVRGVRVLVDGIPATLPDGQTTLNHVDPGALGRVEVVRGPASALYGNAAGGVVQLTTAPPPAGAARRGGPHDRAGATGCCGRRGRWAAARGGWTYRAGRHAAELRGLPRAQPGGQHPAARPGGPPRRAERAAPDPDRGATTTPSTPAPFPTRCCAWTARGPSRATGCSAPARRDGRGRPGSPGAARRAPGRWSCPATAWRGRSTTPSPPR